METTPIEYPVVTPLADMQKKTSHWNVVIEDFAVSSNNEYQTISTIVQDLI